MFKLSVVLLTFSCFLFTINTATTAEIITNKNVQRTIDLASQLVKISYKITIDNADGQNYKFLLPENLKSNLAFISAKDSNKKELKINENKPENGDFVYQIVVGSQSLIYIEVVLTKLLQPYPTHIQQSDRQLVRYFDNVYYYSPYKTVTQKTVVHLSSRSIEQFTQVKPTSQSDTTITYGSYENIARKLISLVIHRVTLF